MTTREFIALRLENLRKLVYEQNKFIDELMRTCEKKDEELQILRKEVYELRGKLDDYKANLM